MQYIQSEYKEGIKMIMITTKDFDELYKALCNYFGVEPEEENETATLMNKNKLELDRVNKNIDEVMKDRDQAKKYIVAIRQDYAEKIQALIEECSQMVDEYEKVCLALAEECNAKVDNKLEAYNKKLEVLTNHKAELLKKLG